MTKQEIKDTIEFVLNNIDEYRNVLSKVQAIKPHLVELVLAGEITERDFYKLSSLLNSQARSPMWEKYFIQKHQCRRIKRQEDMGDFEKNGKHYEYKCSGFNQDGSVHIVQIRTWQKCHYIVQSISDKKVHTFELSHEDMLREIDLLGASVAHGTRTSNIKNQNIELRMTLVKDSENWARWRRKYTTRSFF